MKIKVAAIILVSGDKALLQLRDNKPDIPHPNTWGFAGGGKLDGGESFEDGAIRELFEETGYKSHSP
jgi:8-oxo-dGTP pyrophosphatase MutT (NUDIX family)